MALLLHRRTTRSRKPASCEFLGAARNRRPAPYLGWAYPFITVEPRPLRVAAKKTDKVSKASQDCEPSLDGGKMLFKQGSNGGLPGRRRPKLARGSLGSNPRGRC